MSQLLKKFALLTACAVLALCFATRPAHAQMVAAGGTGEHLIFAYWSTADGMNTNVNIHSPLGVKDSGEMMNVIKVVVKDEMGEEVTNFKICLMPGDSWTATLSMSDLMVMDAGECDGDVEQDPDTRTSTPVSTPMMGETVSLGEASSGYLEAWVAPRGGLKDGTVLEAGENDPGIDADNATPRDISGTAMLVSPMSGFSSSYNATALSDCLAKDVAGDTGNGCWDANEEGASIQTALGSQNKDFLTGRWTAISDANVTSHTKVVLTLPVNHLNHKIDDADGDEVDGTDPVSIHVFNDMGRLALSNYEVVLGMNVNTCEFMTTGLSCNGMDVGEIDGYSGEFRIFNNNADETTNGKVNDTESADGTEMEGLGDDTNRAGGPQDAEEPLSAIGLICSYFMGTDDNPSQYDQITPVQWIDVAADASDLY